MYIKKKEDRLANDWSGPCTLAIVQVDLDQS